MEIPVVFTINNSYIKQLSTVLTSILETGSSNNIYKFYILSTDIQRENKNILTNYIKKYPNSSIVFTDLSAGFINKNLEKFMSRRENYTYISTETYYRFFIPELFKQYDKILYFDSDILVLNDIALLYNENIENYYLGAVQDRFMTGQYNNQELYTQQYPYLTFKDYLLEILNKTDSKYFNAGILLLNIKKINEDNMVNKLWEFAEQKSPLEFQDQDVLNAVFNNHVKFLDPRWNTLKGAKIKSKPYVMHFVGPEKPWFYNENFKYNYEFIKNWWENFQKTPFYMQDDCKTKKMILEKSKIKFADKIFSIKDEENHTALRLLGLCLKIRTAPKKIKVALLIDEFFGGAGTAFGGYGFLARKYVAKYIPNKNITIDVLLERKKGLSKTICETVDDINIYRLPENDKKAKKWLNKQNYDLFLSIEMTYPSYEIMKLVKNKKLLLWIQDPRPQSIWEEKRKTMSIIQDPCVCDQNISTLVQQLYHEHRVKFISQGDSLNPLAAKLYGIPENFDVKYIPNPIDIDLSYNFDITKKKKQVIFLGRLEAQKRAWLFCEVAKKMPEYEFYVMGKFFRDEENNKKPLEKYINGNIPNLHFVGHVDGEKKEKLIRESRVLLNTSIWEGIPISWLEVLQYGTTIVSCLNNENLPNRFGTYVGEILGDGYDKVDLFIPAIKELMENDELYINKARSAIAYIRQTHNVNSFKSSLRQSFINALKKYDEGQVIKQIKRPVNIANTRAIVDVKISYACNFKCEYCYQVNEDGTRYKGFFKKENIDKLILFLQRINERCRVNLVGGEPFIYPYLNEFAKKLIKEGHVPNIITNFSVPWDNIESFLNIVKNDLVGFSISVHISQWKNIGDFYDKLEKLLEYKKKHAYTWEVRLTCVITENNFDKAIKIGEYVKEHYGIIIANQRVYHNGIYKIYSDRIEEYFKKHSLDVSEEKANNIDFGDRYCWAGAKFFYVEHNGNVQRCYTPQYDNVVLGNLRNYKKIKISKYPTPCLSKNCGNCVCFEAFLSNEVVTDIKPNLSKLSKIKNNIARNRTIKYNLCKLLYKISVGKTKKNLQNKMEHYSV